MCITPRQRIKQGSMPVYRATPNYTMCRLFPTLYLLDKEKRIVAKKLAVDQIDEVLQLKRKNN